MRRNASVALCALVCALALTFGASGKAGAAPPPAERATAWIVARSSTEFAINLYAKLSAQKGNLFLSPYSITTALAMTASGARGQTAEQMTRVLHLSADPSVPRAFAAMLSKVNGAGSGHQLDIANSIWMQSGGEFLQSFRDTARTSFGAQLGEVDFQRAHEAARKQINDWASKQTRGKIPELLGDGAVTPATHIVLANAIYFKGAWQEPFDAEQTVSAPFRLSAGEQAPVPMMRSGRRAKYFDGGTFQAIELPYTSNALSMVILLPRAADGLPELEASLTADKLKTMFYSFDEKDVAITLPKFKITSGLELSKTLADMGMPDAFSPDADFTGISAAKGLYISGVIHRAFVEVNEVGTEAAAATAGVMDPKGMTHLGPKRIPFQADHPFLFLIRDHGSEGIVFMGRVADPR